MLNVPTPVRVFLCTVATDMRKSFSGLQGLIVETRRLLDGTHPAGVRLARFWLFRGFEAAPYNVFYFHESRARDGPSEFLRDFRGLVKVDAYGVDDAAETKVGRGGRLSAEPVVGASELRRRWPLADR